MTRDSADRVLTSLEDWLAWQETLNPAEIILGLDRVAAVAERLGLQPPVGRVFTVAGTNGKGSTVAVLDAVLAANGYRVGVYTSPHLVRYNERIRIAGTCATDAAIVSAFERIEAARDDVPLTYFEFGTLAALLCFSAAECDAWVLEVGLGGRLDAVNIIDPDFALITTVDLDHQAWLGNDIETIAAEKAGIMRAGIPAFYGDSPVPAAVTEHARDLGAPLRTPGDGFVADISGNNWQWCGQRHTLSGLALPAGGAVQIRNQSLALAAVEACDPGMLAVLESDPDLLANTLPPGRCQHHRDAHHWLLDVAHNVQAGRALAAELAGLQPETVVMGMLADKQAAEFVAALGVAPERWLLCPSQGSRGATATELAAMLGDTLEAPSTPFSGVAEALTAAQEQTSADGLILVCGTFGVVGPALEWLGLYSGDTG